MRYLRIKCNDCRAVERFSEHNEAAVEFWQKHRLHDHEAKWFRKKQKPIERKSIVGCLIKCQNCGELRWLTDFSTEYDGWTHEHKSCRKGRT